MTLSGEVFLTSVITCFVLIPLLVDDPLWVKIIIMKNVLEFVLIPLLVDDPLWEG